MNIDTLTPQPATTHYQRAFRAALRYSWRTILLRLYGEEGRTARRRDYYSIAANRPNECTYRRPLFSHFGRRR